MKSRKTFIQKIYKLLPLMSVLLLVVGLGYLSLTKSPSQAQAQTGSFTFGVAGDYSSTSNTDAVLTLVKNSGLNFHIAVGDLSYNTQGSPGGWGTYVKNIIGTVPFPIIMGNHDASKIDQFVAALPNPMSNAQGTYGKQYYFDYPQTAPLARFILMSPVDGTKDINWLNTSIDGARTAGIKWVIVGMHQPCLAVGQKSCESGQDLLSNLITKKADLVLYGHDHNYQRTKQLSCATANTFNASCVAAAGPTFTQGAGTVFATVGTGGNSFYNVSASDSEAGYFAVMNSNTYGILKVTVSASQLSAQFVKAGGGTLSDSFTINSSAVIPSTVPSTALSPVPSGPSGTAFPTFGGIGTCPGNPACPTNEPSPAVTGGQPNPSGVTVQPSTGTNNPSISPTPCTAGGTAVATSHEKSNHHSHNGNISGFMETLLRFFIELINLLLKLIGGGQINLPNPDPSNPDPGNPCNT